MYMQSVLGALEKILQCHLVVDPHLLAGVLGVLEGIVGDESQLPSYLLLDVELQLPEHWKVSSPYSGTEAATESNLVNLCVKDKNKYFKGNIGNHEAIKVESSKFLDCN